MKRAKALPSSYRVKAMLTCSVPASVVVVVVSAKRPGAWSMTLRTTRPAIRSRSAAVILEASPPADVVRATLVYRANWPGAATAVSGLAEPAVLAHPVSRMASALNRIRAGIKRVVRMRCLLVMGVSGETSVPPLTGSREREERPGGRRDEAVRRRRRMNAIPEQVAVGRWTDGIADDAEAETGVVDVAQA